MKKCKAALSLVLALLLTMTPVHAAGGASQAYQMYWNTIEQTFSMESMEYTVSAKLVITDENGESTESTMKASVQKLYDIFGLNLAVKEQTSGEINNLYYHFGFLFYQANNGDWIGWELDGDFGEAIFGGLRYAFDEEDDLTDLTMERNASGTTLQFKVRPEELDLLSIQDLNDYFDDLHIKLGTTGQTLLLDQDGNLTGWNFVYNLTVQVGGRAYKVQYATNSKLKAANTLESIRFPEEMYSAHLYMME